MKLIEGLKKIQTLTEKAEDIRKKISQYCADLDFENPVYPDQRGQVAEWLQAHEDILREILRLREAVQKKNLETQVTVELGGKQVTKSIAAWIHRRRDLAKLSLAAWEALTDRKLQDCRLQTTTGGTIDAKVRRYFDARDRDEHQALYRAEPTLIDAALEVANAVTDLE